MRHLYISIGHNEGASIRTTKYETLKRNILDNVTKKKKIQAKECKACGQ